MKASLRVKQQSILKTSYTYFLDDCWVTESPLSPRSHVMGVGVTKEDSIRLFEEMLDEYLDDLATGKNLVIREVGRPSKGKTPVRIDIKPDVKLTLASLAKQFGISQGETVELMIGLYQHNGQLVKPV